MKGAALTMISLTKRYGDVVAVDAVSLEVRAGEFLTLLGPSGSGKTTVMRMIAGFVAPTAGDIQIDGRSVIRRPPHKREVGMVFQNYALFPHMTVYGNVAFALHMRKVSGEQLQRRVQAALDMVQLGSFAGRYPRQLSGGQQQRVALARTLVFQPRALLMDEPLGALDKKLREHMQIELKRIQRELGLTILHVTHDQEEALTMSDRIAVLNRGRILQLGTPQELYERPAGVFVASFLGRGNFFSGRLTEADERGGTVETVTGLHIRVGPATERQRGDPVTVLVRPEKVRLLAGDAKLPNAFPARVDSVMFLGDAVGISGVFPRGEQIFVKAQAGTLPDLPKPDDEVTVGWAPDDVILLEAT